MHKNSLPEIQPSTKQNVNNYTYASLITLTATRSEAHEHRKDNEQKFEVARSKKSDHTTLARFPSSGLHGPEFNEA